MNREDVLEVEGVVTAQHKAGLFSVEAQLGPVKRIVLARLSGRLHMHHIRILEGDVVQLEVSAYDMSRARIVYRGRREQRPAP